MSSSDQSIQSTVTRFDAAMVVYKKGLDDRIIAAEDIINSDLLAVKALVVLRAEIQTLRAVRLTAILVTEAHQYYLAFWMPYSPSLFAILSAIWGVLTVVYNAVKWFITFIRLKEILAVIDILQIVWPEFRAKMQKIYEKVSEYSAAIGWGADGISHLIQATQGIISVTGGILGKSDAWGEVKYAEKAMSVLYEISARSYAIENDPGNALNQIFKWEAGEYKRELSDWWVKTAAFIDTVSDMANLAAEGVKSTVNELLSIQVGMPQYVRDNIPQSIWDNLEKADSYISDVILPKLAKIDNTLTQINNALGLFAQKNADLASLIAHPGTVLLGVDDLPEYARMAQEGFIDEITSREMARDAMEDRFYIQPDLEAFDIIDKAMEAPTVPPPFMTLEDPARKALTGIIVEPKENWFVGDF